MHGYQYAGMTRLLRGNDSVQTFDSGTPDMYNVRFCGTEGTAVEAYIGWTDAGVGVFQHDRDQVKFRRQRLRPHSARNSVSSPPPFFAATYC